MIQQWTVGDVMTRDVDRVTEHTPYRTIVDLLTRRAISAAPVVDVAGRVVGLVSEADLLHRIEFIGEEHDRRVIERPTRHEGRARSHAACARDLMSSPAITATRDPVVTPAGPPPVVTTTTRTTTSAPPPRSPVPAQLVGSWGGGSTGSTAGRSYTFGRDGDVLYRRGTEDVQGTVVIRGSVLTMYFPGVAPQKYRWSVESYEVSGYAFSNLYLDGFTYVRQDSP